MMNKEKKEGSIVAIYTIIFALLVATGETTIFFIMLEYKVTGLLASILIFIMLCVIPTGSAMFTMNMWKRGL